MNAVYHFKMVTTYINVAFNVCSAQLQYIQESQGIQPDTEERRKVTPLIRSRLENLARCSAFFVIDVLKHQPEIKQGRDFENVPISRTEVYAANALELRLDTFQNYTRSISARTRYSFKFAK